MLEESRTVDSLIAETRTSTSVQCWNKNVASLLPLNTEENFTITVINLIIFTVSDKAVPVEHGAGGYNVLRCFFAYMYITGTSM